MCFAQDLQKLFRRFLARISQQTIFKPQASPRMQLVIQASCSVSYNAAAFGANPLGRPPSPRGDDNCSGDHFRRMRSWRHWSEALKGFLCGGFGFVSVRFQDNGGLDGTAVALKK
jgi:hypothetical protein